jgi:hypothetical protein
VSPTLELAIDALDRRCEVIIPETAVDRFVLTKTSCNLGGWVKRLTCPLGEGRYGPWGASNCRF